MSAVDSFSCCPISSIAVSIGLTNISLGFGGSFLLVAAENLSAEERSLGRIVETWSCSS